MSHHPIGDLAFLSDMHSAALVDRAATVVWLAFPRFDSPPVFASLLGEEAGHWHIRPVHDHEVTRRYVDDSLVVETTFATCGGTAVITDALALASDDAGHLLGAGAPHVLLRRVRVEEGQVDFEVEFVPRPEYGLDHPLLCRDGDAITTRGAPEALSLSTDVALDLADSIAAGRFTLASGQDATFALQWARAWESPPRSWTPREIRERIDETVRIWGRWADEHQAYEGPWRDLVRTSGRILHGLTFQPTGAIVAAATTSLPEVIGGERNWDYRYSWVRDASLTLRALWVAACPAEADAFLKFLVGSAAADLRRGGHLQIMYGVGGEHDLTERVVDHLPGWRDSRPVRVGNAAWSQRQLDVYGQLLDATARLQHQMRDLDDASRGFLVACADAAAASWTEPDEGIWEVRGGPQHFVHSKLMCWVALDRAITMADWLRGEDRVEQWAGVRADIRAAILERGWSDSAKSFTQAFDSDVLDASVLMIAIMGLLPADDERMQATIAAVEERLTDARGLVYRYEHTTDDGLPGQEGTFLLCTFWLAYCHALAGHVHHAREVFERAVAFRNDLGLLSEEVETATGELIGNVPQAFSHVGLVNAAWAIHQAQSRP
ncbi:MAG: glycoside hydrolase family 15 protein [Actinomycetota bacterium]|nr:glycoside hydrolase family 15 protein [Actinomycetota bacterium]